MAKVTFKTCAQEKHTMNGKRDSLRARLEIDILFSNGDEILEEVIALHQPLDTEFSSNSIELHLNPDGIGAHRLKHGELADAAEKVYREGFIAAMFGDNLPTTAEMALKQNFIRIVPKTVEVSEAEPTGGW